MAFLHASPSALYLGFSHFSRPFLRNRHTLAIQCKYNSQIPLLLHIKQKQNKTLGLCCYRQTSHDLKQCTVNSRLYDSLQCENLGPVCDSDAQAQ